MRFVLEIYENLDIIALKKNTFGIRIKQNLSSDVSEADIGNVALKGAFGRGVGWGQAGRKVALKWEKGGTKPGESRERARADARIGNCRGQPR